MAELRAPQPGAEILSEPMRSRWSPALFDPSHTISDDELALLLTAARWAPSWGNSQPWSFVVLRRGTPAHQAFTEHLTQGNSVWVPRASAVIVGATQIAPNPDGKGGMAPEYHRYDLGQAMAHLTLQAVAAGLVAHQFSGFEHEDVQADLGIPPWYTANVAVAVGIHADPDSVDLTDEALAALVDKDQNRPRKRKALSSIAFDGHWGAPLPS